ncbi:hypothetical protein [Flavobacterium sp. LB2P53]|nr:hypothetical protein [Flavobacterium sp. LB2P53]
MCSFYLHIHNQYYRLTLDKKKKKATSLFPLNEDEIAAIDSSEILLLG